MHVCQPDPEDVYPVRNNAPLLCSPAFGGIRFYNNSACLPVGRAGFNASLEFLTG